MPYLDPDVREHPVEGSLYIDRSEVRQILLRHHLATALREVEALPVFTAEDIEREASPGRSEETKPRRGSAHDHPAD